MNEEEVDILAERSQLVKELRLTNQGQALVDLLQEWHNVLLGELISADANDVGRTAKIQGKYEVIFILLNRIMEEEDATDG